MTRQVKNTRTPDWITKRELEKTAEEGKAKETCRQQFEASKLVQQGARTPRNLTQKDIKYLQDDTGKFIFVGSRGRFPLPLLV